MKETEAGRECGLGEPVGRLWEMQIMGIIRGPSYGIWLISVLKFTLIGALIVAFILLLLLFLPSKIGDDGSSRNQ